MNSIDKLSQSQAARGTKPTVKSDTRGLRRIGLYMFYNAAGEVPEYVTFKLKKLRELCERVVVVCNGVLLPEGRDALESVADLVHVRKNVGFDVWAYREGLIDLIGWDELANYDELVLANYTFYGPIFPFSEMFEKMEKSGVDFWGVTAFSGPVPNFFTNKGFIETHIQSHFIAVRQPMLSSPEFRQYWETMPEIENYVGSVINHEIRFSEYFSKLGYRWGVYSDPKKYPVAQVAYEVLDLILEDRCPILKRKPFFNDPLNVDRSNVELQRALDILRSKSDYDPSLIWRDIAPVTKPRDLYTNATLFEVPLATGKRAELDPKTRIAVLAHVFYPEMVGEILSHARNIPVPFDLFITTATPEKKKAIETALAGEKGFTLKDVRVVQNRGRDISALLLGLRDVVLEGGYDYACRLHSKASPQDTFGMARHFKEHLFENLLLNPTYVSNLLSIFENDPMVGVIFPPTIHIGYATLGHSWFNNRQGAEEWARRLGIKVPFDDYTPLCAHGSMYWFRPQALRRLFEYPLKWSDFPEEPHYADGDVPHILERLVVYTAHAAGYYGKCVLTPANASKNYVKLQYKLRRQVIDAWHKANPPVAFPTKKVSAWVKTRLSPQTTEKISKTKRLVQNLGKKARRGATA